MAEQEGQQSSSFAITEASGPSLDSGSFTMDLSALRSNAGPRPGAAPLLPVQQQAMPSPEHASFGLEPWPRDTPDGCDPPGVDGVIDLTEARRETILRSSREETQGAVDAEPAIRGPHYSSHVWAYYRTSGAWSDGLCVSLQKPGLCAECCCPILWFRRLFLALSRSLPLELTFFGVAESSLETTRGACAATLTVACLLLACGGCALLGGVHELHGSMAPELFAPSLFFFVAGAFAWAWLLLAVGKKYHIAQVEEAPCAALVKMCCCLCLMNVRVGLHIDRSHGFAKPSRAVTAMVERIELSEQSRRPRITSRWSGNESSPV
eukprot:TRINITY_DN53704_c0_g1_i1.p1 TRINITY_DN53704_c0_g1~~TRINITY_DN53704_c0_g1_i1.p1  ORF type:complete len:322 (-),score=54.93 TRINITY_DN53704_c0_g1_i1:28-993(-)